MRKIGKQIAVVAMVMTMGAMTVSSYQIKQEQSTVIATNVQAKKGTSKVVNDSKSNKVSNRKRKKKYLIVADDKKVSSELMSKIDTIENQEVVQDDKIIAVTELTAGEAKQMKKRKGILHVEKDGTVSASTSETKTDQQNQYDENEWNVQAVKADEVNIEKKKGQRNVRVAVIDSGMDVTPELNVVERVNLVPEDKGTDVMFEDVTQHGTSVAGIIASQGGDRITGINPNVDLYSVKVLDNTNNAPISRVIEGIYWAIEKEVDIINMSFGTYENSEALKQAVNAANEAGILMIAAAGNNEEKGVQYPAAYDEVVAVGSVNNKEEHSKNSAIGDEVELVAPGEQVKSLGFFGTDIVASGTSMAAPHVAGVASLIWQKDIKKDNKYIRKLLNESATDIGAKRKYGNGLVNAKYANAVYDKFEMNYQEDIKDRIVKKNTDKREVFLDVEPVSASWDKDDHKSMIVEKHHCYTGDSWMDAGLACEMMKWGAKNIDLLKSGSVNKNLGFHGHGNYIANYIYLTKVGMNDGSRIGVSKPITGNQSLDNVYTVLGELTKNTIVNQDPDFFKSHGGYSQTARGYIVWGFAIHTATDAFAHRAKGYKDGIWWRILHDNSSNPEGYTHYIGGADNPNTFPDRYAASFQVVRNAVKRFNTNKAGSYTDFLLGSYYTGTFKLENLYQFASAVGKLSDSQKNELQDATWKK